MAPLVMHRFDLCLVIVLVFTCAIQWSSGVRFFSRGWLNHFYPPPVYSPADGPLPQDEWFDQTLDHFNDADTRTWKQRFFRNDSFYKPGGPVFLSISGEGKANPIWMVKGAWIEYAKKFNAYCLLLEHRYYGKSHPTEDMSVDNLRFLSSEQALADLAKFITVMKKQEKLGNAKWIVFGGSYPGSLAAWIRLKYPHLIHGAVASSAPLQAQLNFDQYLAVVRDSLDLVSPTCTKVISKAIRTIELLLLHQVGWQTLQKLFKLCDPLDGRNKMDVQNFFSSLSGNFEGVVQYSGDNREFEGVKGANITMKDLCHIMDDSNLGTPLDRYAAVNLLMLSVGEQKCLDFKYENMIKSLSNITWDSEGEVGGRQWTYQTCTEFGYFQTSDLSDQPFGHYFPLAFSLQQCQDAFGSKFSRGLIERGIARTNTDYGAKDIKVTRVLFPNGSVDPWHALGLTEDPRAIYINGTAHCANMYPSSPDDPPSLVQARRTIEAELGNWLSTS